MIRILLLPILCVAGSIAHSQQPSPAEKQDDLQPLPSIPQLLQDVERNQKLAESVRKDYTYHVHQEEQELDGKGQLKKTTTTDSESLNLRGVRINRVVARNGKPLTPDEAAKESERIDDEIAKDTERREKEQRKGEQTDSRGDVLISASRILELGVFSNARRVMLNGRPTIVLDYAGDPKAKTRNSAENVIRDLVGTAWIDEQDRILARAQGHFLDDFKIGGGLIADIRKGSSFEAQFSRINDEVWLPGRIEGQGRIRILLVSGFNGRFSLVTSDYRKFRTSSNIEAGGTMVQPDGSPLTMPPSLSTPQGSPATHP
jgi:hypothetical protein